MTITAERPQADTIVATTLRASALRNALAATLLSVSKDKTLPVLEGVHVSKVGDTFTFSSTDRYRLTRVTVTVDGSQDHGDWATLISAADVKRIVAMLPKGGVLLATIAPDTVAAVASASLSFTPVDGQFPKVENIIPTTTEAVEEIGFNPSFLADLAKMPGFRKNGPAHFKFNGAGKPARVEWTDDNHGNVSYIYLLMPVRVNS